MARNPRTPKRAPCAGTDAYLRLLDVVFDAAFPRPATQGPTGPPSAA